MTRQDAVEIIGILFYAAICFCVIIVFIIPCLIFRVLYDKN